MKYEIGIKGKTIKTKIFGWINQFIIMCYVPTIIVGTVILRTKGINK